MEKRFTVEGMTCKHCVATVKELLQEIDGVEQVTVSLENKEAIVKGEPKFQDVQNAFAASPFKIATK